MVKYSAAKQALAAASGSDEEFAILIFGHSDF
jgi:hypothetical protein